MTTLIVLPTPPATRAPAPAQGESGGDATDAGRFAALLDAAMATGTDGAPTDATTDGTAADGAAPTGAVLTLVPPLAESADGATADATDGAEAPADAPTAVPVDGVSLLLASGVGLGAAVPPGAPSSPMPEPNPDGAAQAHASASAGTSAIAPLGDATAPTPTTATGAAVQPSSHPGAGAATTQGEAPAEAPTAQSAERATTDQGDLTTEAARPGEVAGSGFGHAERSGAGGTPRPAAPPEVSNAVNATAAAAPVTTTDRVSTTTATTATETARPVAAQIVEQLDARWPAVKVAGPGTHVMTLRLEPEHFGPLRVVAHIGAEGVRIELLGSTEAARDALRQALPDLKRDLVGVGLSADLDLGSRGQNGQNGQGVRADGGASGDASGRGDRSDQGDRPASGTRGDRPVPDGALPTQTTATARRGRLDLTV